MDLRETIRENSNLVMMILLTQGLFIAWIMPYYGSPEGWECAHIYRNSSGGVVRDICEPGRGYPQAGPADRSSTDNPMFVQLPKNDQDQEDGGYYDKIEREDYTLGRHAETK